MAQPQKFTEDDQAVLQYIREDIKEMRKELNAKIDKMSETLAAHTKEDNTNFKDLIRRADARDVSDQTRAGIKTIGFGRFTSWTALVLSAIANIILFLKH